MLDAATGAVVGLRETLLGAALQRREYRKRSLYGGRHLIGVLLCIPQPPYGDRRRTTREVAKRVVRQTTTTTLPAASIWEGRDRPLPER
jgi:hypothetical protein